jgi:hypothetical protein
MLALQIAELRRQYMAAEKRLPDVDKFHSRILELEQQMVCMHGCMDAWMHVYLDMYIWMDGWMDIYM